MSRIRIALEGSRTLLVGFDPPFDTYYAMLYVESRNTLRRSDEPDKAVGYHPIERSPNEITEHGPYPCDLETLRNTLIEWGLNETEVEVAVQAASEDGPH